MTKIDDLKAGDEHYMAFVGPPHQYDLMGATQFRLLCALGMRSHHRVLDFGCGSLRAGRLIIPDLESGRYFGIEPNSGLVNDGISAELGDSVLEVKKPRFADVDEVSIPFEESFDFIIAQSIFSHAGLGRFRTAIGNFTRALNRRGLVLLTCVEGRSDCAGEDWVHPGCVTFTPGTIHGVARENGLHSIRLPWYHPRQSWYLFAKDREKLPGWQDRLLLTGAVLFTPEFGESRAPLGRQLRSWIRLKAPAGLLALADRIRRRARAVKTAMPGMTGAADAGGLQETRGGRDMTRRAGLGAGTLAALVALAAAPAAAETPSLNLYGVTGLIDMPSALAQPDAQLSATVSNFAGQTRTTLTFQVLPRVSGSFRYTGVKDWNEVVASPFDTYYDRSFDLRFQLLNEGRYLPAVAIGLQDFLGTGLYSGEYVVATKTIGPVAVTGGLGWGRLGSSGDFGTPFGDRPERDFGQGGDFEPDQYFRGPVAPFFGLEWRPAERWSLKAEYSSDAYELEERRGLLERQSDWNFGVEYQAFDWLRLGAYSLYGSEVGVSAQLSFNLKERPNGPGREPAPIPIEPRPDRRANPEAYATGWAGSPAIETQFREGLAPILAEAGIRLEGLEVGPQSARIWIRNVRYDSEPQALGRTARIAARVLPASVERIVIVPVTETGMPISQVAFGRSDLERFEVAPAGAARLRAETGIAPATKPPAPEDRVDGLYPELDLGFGPYLRFSYFDPEEPLRYQLGAELEAEWRLAPGLLLSGRVTKSLLDTIDDADTRSNSDLPRVRTNWPRYAREGDPALAELTAAYYFRPGPDIYGRVTAGYLERMFGGVSGELLWKPVSSRLALGAELNYAVQRDFDTGFGFRDYDVVTGHASAYYDLGGGFQAQLDAGRYLAGDWGATFSLAREFGNGWRVGAFATLTDVSSEEFGEGSFDKGISLRIPISWFTGQPTRRGTGFTIRPVTRDGGARLRVDGRLYGQVRQYHATGLDPQWGRFWR